MKHLRAAASLVLLLWVFLAVPSAQFPADTTTLLNQFLVALRSGTITLTNLTVTGTCSGCDSGGALPSLAQCDLIYASGVNTTNTLTKSTTATRYVANTGTNNNPAWAQINLANGVTSTLPVANGGTGSATLGSDTQVCFNDGGVIKCGDAGLTYNKTSNILTATGGLTVTSAAADTLLTLTQATDASYLWQWTNTAAGVEFSGWISDAGVLNLGQPNGGTVLWSSDGFTFVGPVAESYTVASMASLGSSRPNSFSIYGPATNGTAADGFSALYLGSRPGYDTSNVSHAFVGNAGGLTAVTTIGGSGSANNEYAGLYYAVVANIGTGYTQTTGPVGALWGADFSTIGPIAVQPKRLNGITQNIENYYNGNPSATPSGGMWIVTAPGTGGSVDATHAAATTYPIQVGVGVVGNTGGGTTAGFTRAFQAGGTGSPWEETLSLIGTAYYGRDIQTFGLDLYATEGADLVMRFASDEGDDAADIWLVKVLATGNAMTWTNAASLAMTLTTAGVLTPVTVRPSTSYQSVDGTAGATVTTCTGFKNGLCISGT